MSTLVLPRSLLALALLSSACSSEPAIGELGSGGMSAAGSGGGPTTSGGTAGLAGGGSSAGTSGDGPGGTSGSGGAAGSSGSAGTGGSAGSAGTGGAGDADPVAPRPLAVDPLTACNCELDFSPLDLDPDADVSSSPTHAGDTQHMKVDPSKPMQGKLAVVLGGIGGGPGPGGIYGYAVSRGFHAFMVATQTNESSAPDEYKDSQDPEDNRQVGDARLEAWDGTDRVSWLDVQRPGSVEHRTELALAHAAEQDPGGDWGWYLNSDGSVRWTDVILVGYSFGSQTIAMVSKYKRFGRALITSGPTDEGFPSATWITEPSVTPLERMFVMVGSSDIGDKIETVQAAGWLGDPLDVNAGALGPFTANILVLVGQGHSEMCAGDGGDWAAICDYGFGVK
jgi:hypothetical protein